MHGVPEHHFMLHACAALHAEHAAVTMLHSSAVRLVREYCFCRAAAFVCHPHVVVRLLLLAKDESSVEKLEYDDQYRQVLLLCRCNVNTSELHALQATAMPY